MCLAVFFSKNLPIFKKKKMSETALYWWNQINDLSFLFSLKKIFTVRFLFLFNTSRLQAYICAFWTDLKLIVCWNVPRNLVYLSTWVIVIRNPSSQTYLLSDFFTFQFWLTFIFFNIFILIKLILFVNRFHIENKRLT